MIIWETVEWHLLFLFMQQRVRCSPAAAVLWSVSENVFVETENVRGMMKSQRIHREKKTTFDENEEIEAEKKVGRLNLTDFVFFVVD